jgi:hypothetical protein
VSAWRIDAVTGVETCQIYGPYAGWTPVSIAVDADFNDQILWNYTSSEMSMWCLTKAGVLTYYLYGPYASWNAVTVNVGPVDDHDYVMWSYPGGTMSVWNISSPGTFTYNIQAPPTD